MTVTLLHLATITLLAGPFLAFVMIGLRTWFGRPFGERTTAYVVSGAFGTALAAALTAAGLMIQQGVTDVRLPLGAWFTVSHYAFRWELVLDWLSLSFATLGAALIGLVSVFSRRYLHREPGYTRFYLLLTLLGLGVEIVALAGSLDLIVPGWELVGIASALLIAYFQERKAPSRHGLRAFVTYRFCDVGLLGAAVWLHHTTGGSSLTASSGPWLGLPPPADGTDVVIVGLLLIWATMGKSALVPLGGWLPRAMEGPTPSSAIFYGALSIHLGPLLLLRAAPLLERSSLLTGVVLILGLVTALHATLVGRTQTDIKSALAYASMTQVGLIVVEIGLGLHVVALVHLVGHAALRTLQLLRAPNLLHDHRRLEAAIGSHLPRAGGHLERLVPRSLQPWLYRHALERGYWDAWLQDHLVGGFVRLMRRLDRLEQSWIIWLAHAPSRRQARTADSSPSEAH